MIAALVSVERLILVSNFLHMQQPWCEMINVMEKCKRSFPPALLIVASIFSSQVSADQNLLDLYEGGNFVLGTGAAIVRFDTNIKVTDKNTGNSTYLDLEGNLDLPEVSSVLTLYGVYQINQKHRLGFTFFGINRESSVFNIDKTFEDIRVVGEASFTDTTNFYRVDYGYNLFRSTGSSIDLMAGVYGLDLKYVFKAEGSITVDGVTSSGSIEDETSIFAPLPLIGLNFNFHITDSWRFMTKVSFIAGTYQDLSAVVSQTTINALYGINKNVGVVLGMSYFDADIDIESSSKIRDISYGYDGAYIGMHFFI